MSTVFKHTFVLFVITVIKTNLLFAAGIEFDDDKSDFASAPSGDDNRYESVCIVNSTKVKVAIQYHWGKESFRYKQIEPESVLTIFWDNIEEKSNWSPELRIGYDDDPVTNSVTRYGSRFLADKYHSSDTSCNSAKQYYFKYDGSKLELIAN